MVFKVDSVGELFERALANSPEEIALRYHIDEMHIANLVSGGIIGYDGLPGHLQVPEMHTLYEEFAEWCDESGNDTEWNRSKYGHRFLEVLKALRSDPDRAGFDIIININGTEEDIAALWKTWPRPDEINIESTSGYDIYKNKLSSKGVLLSTEPQGKRAEGTLFSLPDNKKAIAHFFDDLFAAHPNLSFLIIAKERKDGYVFWDYFWWGINGKLHKSWQDGDIHTKELQELIDDFYNLDEDGLDEEDDDEYPFDDDDEE